VEDAASIVVAIALLARAEQIIEHTQERECFSAKMHRSCMSTGATCFCCRSHGRRSRCTCWANGSVVSTESDTELAGTRLQIATKLASEVTACPFVLWDVKLKALLVNTAPLDTWRIHHDSCLCRLDSSSRRYFGAKQPDGPAAGNDDRDVDNCSW
jgi:hypothetical protein